MRLDTQLLWNDPEFLKSRIINALVRKVFKLVTENQPKTLKDMKFDYYIGAFDGEPIYLVPRSMIDDSKWKIQITLNKKV